MIQSVIIIGAGLSGLTTAYFLKKKGIESLIIEARDKVGGRINTSVNGDFHSEMGATWLGPQHTVLLSLLEELNVSKFEQYSEGKGIVSYGPQHPPYFYQKDPNDPPTYRIANGSQSIIEALIHESNPQIILNSKVEVIRNADSIISVATKSANYQAYCIVCTIPPKLADQTIVFDPPLPAEVSKQMQATHTWMSNSIKFSIEYENPFWKEAGFSGGLMSPGGPVIEMYDHSTQDGKGVGLKGFLSEDLRRYSTSERKKIVLKFISHFLGDEAMDCVAYLDKDWSEDKLTTTEDFESIQQHPVYQNALFQKEYMNDSLILSGTEASPHYAGYMEGAVYSGIRSAQQVLYKLKSTA